jgi:hypothetical protein
VIPCRLRIAVRLAGSIMAATITSQAARKPASVTQNGGSSTSSHNGSPCA